ncbi:hypothetical protein [Thiolapillus sp.]
MLTPATLHGGQRRLVRHGRRYVLRFARGDPSQAALARCYAHVLAL